MNLQDLDEVLAAQQTRSEQTIEYSEIRTIRKNGVRLVQLPNGVLMRRVFDRREGRHVWVRHDGTGVV